jgi:hypothetical protein
MTIKIIKLTSCRYFAMLYSCLLTSYVIVVAVEGGGMVKALPWGLLAIVALGGIALVTSYKTEQLARTEWLLITMGEQSKRKVRRRGRGSGIRGEMENALPGRLLAVVVLEGIALVSITKPNN